MRNVLVSGGSRGLGLAIASTLAAGNYRVIAFARRETAELRAAMDLVDRDGRGGLLFRALDLTEFSSIGPFVLALRKEFGAIYGLVNNAGIGTAGLLTMMRESEMERIVRVNALAPMILTKYVLRSMMTERSGRIINVASIVASSGYSGLSVYSATKAALIGFTRSLAREVGRLDITVNAIAPGFIDTDMTQELTEEERAKIERRSALGRMVTAPDVAAAAEYLMSDKARNVTGMTFTIDAGNTA